MQESVKELPVGDSGRVLGGVQGGVREGGNDAKKEVIHTSGVTMRSGVMQLLVKTRSS